MVLLIKIEPLTFKLKKKITDWDWGLRGKDGDGIGGFWTWCQYFCSNEGKICLACISFSSSNSKTVPFKFNLKAQFWISLCEVQEHSLTCIPVRTVIDTSLDLVFTGSASTFSYRLIGSLITWITAV